MITDVHHVGIAVRDLDAALLFYRDALSLPVVKEGEMPARGVRVAMLGVGGSYLEVVEPIRDDSPFAQHIAEHGEGLHHVALWSTGVDGEVERLRDLGVPLTDVQPREGFTGRLSYLAPEAFGGAQIEVVEPDETFAGKNARGGPVARIDHVVLRVPSVDETSRKFGEWLSVPTKRTMERGSQAFAFLRPGDVIVELIGPADGGEAGSGRVAGLAFAVEGIDGLAEELRAKGYPVGEPHPALQGGRIASVHPSNACGVPVAFIDFAGSPGPPSRSA
jgi:methylmalonyl-CoA epimerase